MTVSDAPKHTPGPTLGGRLLGDAIAELADLHRRDTPEQFQNRTLSAFRWNLTKTDADRILRAAIARGKARA